MWMTLARSVPFGTAQKLRFRDVAEDHKKVEQLEATVAALAAQLKERAAQIQKVSAQVEMNKPATNVRSQ